ncbi:MAG: hypothetical protein CBC13_02795 [Planctomycetia bacterium TMED53]|nr:MAG: hypothetical protein CBC13_02795 [Planctomycetia bacterium TMED53]
MKSIKLIGAGLVGMIVGMAANMALVTVNLMIYPPPEGFDPEKDANAWPEFISTLPAEAFLIPFLAHMAQAFFGGWAAARFTPSYPLRLALVIGILSMIGGIMNQSMIAAPTWTLLELPFYLVFAYLAGNMEKNRRSLLNPAGTGSE